MNGMVDGDSQRKTEFVVVFFLKGGVDAGLLFSAHVHNPVEKHHEDAES
jgi:hypothetical protein